MNNRPVSFFEDQRLTMADSVALTIQSLLAFGSQHRHWAIAFSGGKDSTTVATVVVHAIASGQVPAPETLTVLYADTRQELPPLRINAMAILAEMERLGIRIQVVMPALDDRYFVYMLGRGVPPPSNTFRWCTGQIKVEPMLAALDDLANGLPGQGSTIAPREKVLMITGVRVGESAARDQRIALSCGRNGAECGQGWFQEAKSDAIADTLAPILHWRVCHVWDWLRFEAPTLGFPTQLVADVYGGEQAEEINCRTGCIGCPLASRDTALDNVLSLPQWAYLSPLKRLRPLYRELKRAEHRLRKDGSERRKDGVMVANPMRLGPLTLDARRFGLANVLAVQDEINMAAGDLDRPAISLIDGQEHARIDELIAANTWPNGWDGNEVTGDVMLDEVLAEGIVQPLLSGNKWTGA
jgi:DNA sulfur modification protein DndC